MYIRVVSLFVDVLYLVVDVLGYVNVLCLIVDVLFLLLMHYVYYVNVLYLIVNVRIMLCRLVDRVKLILVFGF